MSPVQIIEYLQNLADDFELHQRHSESIYLREAAALVASHTTAELTKLTMTLGDRVFDMMTAKPEPVLQTTWERQAEKWKAIASYLAMGLENNCRYGLTKDAQNALEQFREAMS